MAIWRRARLSRPEASRRARPLRPFGLAALLLGAHAACTELPDLSVSRCGDGFIDPDTEDCDGPSLTLDGTPYACKTCRLSCAPDATGCAADPAAPGCCPPGWGCGRDRVCGRASGTFEQLGAPIDTLAPRVAAADFDGDGQADIATFGDEVKIHYFTDGAHSSSTIAPSRSLEAVIGQLSVGGRADIALPSVFGLGVLRGQPDGRLEPTAYSLKLNVGKQSRFIVLDARPTETGQGLPQWSGDEILVYGPSGFGGTLRCVEDGEVLVTDFEIQPDLLAARIPIGQIVTGVDSPCDELVLSARGSNRLFVYSPCDKLQSSTGTFIWRSSPQIEIVQLSDDWTVGEGAMLVQGGADRLDLIIFATKSDGAVKLFRAARTANAASPLFEAPVELTLPPPYDGQVLAAGKLNDDDIDDFVGPTHVFLSTGNAVPGGDEFESYPFPIQLPPTNAVMTGATVADLNADGRADVIASFEDHHIEILSNVGDGVWNRLAIPTTGPASYLTVGDFDGDLVADVAFSELANEAGQTSNPAAPRAQMAVVYGRADAAPEPPTRVGSFSGVQGIVTGRDLLPLGTLGDAMDDLALIWGSSFGAIQRQAIFPASTDRRLESPFVFLQQNSGPFTFEDTITYVPLRAAIGNFDADPHADLAVLTDRRDADSAYHLWRLPATVEAQIDAVEVTHGAIDRDAKWGDALLGAVDADACGGLVAVDEVALLAPYGIGSGSNLWLARVDDTKVKSRWTFEPVVLGLPEPAWEAMQVEDVDGDGCKDIVALSKATAGAQALVVFWNRHGFGAISRLDLSSRDAGRVPTAFVCAELENTPGREPAWREILLVAADEAFLAYPDPGSGEIREGSVLLVGETSFPVGGTSVTAGDINHDGLADPVILGNSTLKIFQATPRIR